MNLPKSNDSIQGLSDSLKDSRKTQWSKQDIVVNGRVTYHRSKIHLRKFRKSSCLSKKDEDTSRKKCQITCIVQVTE